MCQVFTGPMLRVNYKSAIKILYARWDKYRLKLHNINLQFVLVIICVSLYHSFPNVVAPFFSLWAKFSILPPSPVPLFCQYALFLVHIYFVFYSFWILLLKIARSLF